MILPVTSAEPLSDSITAGAPNKAKSAASSRTTAAASPARTDGGELHAALRVAHDEQIRRAAGVLFLALGVVFLFGWGAERGAAGQRPSAPRERLPRREGVPIS